MVKNKMLLELLSHLLAFDLKWAAMLILGNLHWVFALFAFTFIAEKGKRPVWHFLTVVGLLYAFGDILGITSWVLIPAIIWATFQLFLGIFFHKDSWARKHEIIIIVPFLLITAFINTFFLAFPGGY